MRLLYIVFIFLLLSSFYAEDYIIKIEPLYKSTKAKAKYLIVSDLSKIKQPYKIIARTKNELIKPLQYVATRSLKVDKVWALGETGSSLILGQADTGISYSSNIASKINAAKDFTLDNNVECIDSDHHGCLVSSIMLNDFFDNGLNYKGVAYDANLVSAKIFDSTGTVPNGLSFTSVFDWILANNAGIINNSWGSGKYDKSCNRQLGVNADGNSDKALIFDFYDYDKAKNNIDLLLFFAAGNSGQCASSQTITNECSAYNVICIGSVDDQNTTNRSDDIVSIFSSRGPSDDNRKKPDLVAVGSHVSDSIRIISQGYSNILPWQGTSAATPFATAIAGLLYNAGKKPLEIKALLINTAEDLGTIGWDKDYGWGLIDAEKAYLQKDFAYKINPSFSDISKTASDINSVTKQNALFFEGDANSCTIAWRRVFDPDDYIQNYDLYLYKGNSSALSNSKIDNVEKVFLADSSKSYAKVKCDICKNISFAIACDSNMQLKKAGFYPLLSKNFFSATGDGNYYINFDLNNDYNFDFNGTAFFYLSNKKYDSNSSLNSFSIKTNSFLPKTASFDLNLYLSNYDENIVIAGDINFLAYDSNNPDINYSGNTSIYSYDNNISLDINIFDDYLYYYNKKFYSDSNTIYDINIFADKNFYDLKIDLNDANILYNKYNLDLTAYDIFGNKSTEKIVFYYGIALQLSKSYNDNGTIYYNEDLSDLNFVFDCYICQDLNLYVIDYNNYSSFTSCSNSNKWYECYDLNNSLLDVNVYTMNKADMFYYVLDLNKAYAIAVKDSNGFVADFLLIKDYRPKLISNSNSKDINIAIEDFDLDSTKTKLYNDSKEINYSIIKDGNVNYITATGSSSPGSHTVELYAYDKADNNLYVSYNYSISSSSGSSSSGGGGGGGSSKKVGSSENKEPENKTEDLESIDYASLSLKEILLLKEKGFVDISNFPYVKLKDIKKAYLKIFDLDRNKIIFNSIYLGSILLGKEYYDKNLLFFAFDNNNYYLKKLIKSPKLKEKEIDESKIDKNKIKPIKKESKEAEKNQDKKSKIKNSFNYLYVLLFLSFIALIPFFVFKKRAKTGI